jgi:hypothetical protein
LCEYNDLFPVTFSEMKGLSRDLGEMNIPLKLEERPYRLNPIYKEKVKVEIDNMLEVGVIETI